MFVHRAHSHRALTRPRMPLIESLESRTLLSADLTPIVNDAGSLIPASLISGDGTRITLKVGVRNIGDQAIGSGQKISAMVMLHRVSDGLETEVATFSGLSISGLKAGATKPFTFNTTLPPGVASGTDHVEIVIDSANVVAEADETNNDQHAAATINVTRGFVALANSIAFPKLPAAIVTGTTGHGPVVVQIHNDGNIAAGPAAKVDVTVVLRPSGGGADITIGSKLAQSIGKVKVGMHKLVSVPTAIATTLPAGTYTIVAIVTPTGFGADASPQATGPTLMAAAAFQDLSIESALTTFAAGTVNANSLGKGTVTIRNLGNSAASGSVTVQFFATNGGAFNGTEKKIGELSKAGTLAAGKSFTAKLNLTLPDVASSSNYTIVARIVPSGFSDSNAANNTRTAGPVTVTPVAGPLGAMGNQITVTGIIDVSSVTDATTYHCSFVDGRGNPGELFITIWSGLFARVRDATLNLFPNGLTSGGMTLKGSAIRTPPTVGTKLVFGSGSIAFLNNSYTGGGSGRVARTN